MPGQSFAQWECPQCGFIVSANDDVAPDAFFRPWHVVHGRIAVQEYVASLGHEAHEWLLALYVDDKYQLLAVDTVARGSVDECKIPFWKLIDRGHRLKAAGYILVHNHPSGNPKPSTEDILVTRRLEDLSRDADMHLLNHLVVTDNDIWIIT